MTASTAKLGWGATLEINTGSDIGAGTWAAAANVLSIGGIDRTVDSVEVTHLTSPNQFREYIPGLKDGATVEFEVDFDPTHATHSASGNGLQALFNARSVRAFRVNLSGAGIARAYAFVGFVEGLSGPGIASPNDPVRMTVSLRISGLVTEQTV